MRQDNIVDFTWMTVQMKSELKQIETESHTSQRFILSSSYFSSSALFFRKVLSRQQWPFKNLSDNLSRTDYSINRLRGTSSRTCSTLYFVLSFKKILITRSREEISTAETAEIKEMVASRTNDLFWRNVNCNIIRPVWRNMIINVLCAKFPSVWAIRCIPWPEERGSTKVHWSMKRRLTHRSNSLPRCNVSDLIYCRLNERLIALFAVRKDLPPRGAILPVQ